MEASLQNSLTRCIENETMHAALKLNFVSVEDYLEGELSSPIKHEYLGGVVHAMVGARNAHNMIATNILFSTYSQLPNTPCRPFTSDTKIRIQLSNQVRFYYPDVSIICDPNPQSDSFQDHPKVIFEVLSKSTRRADRHEKRDAYQTIPTLCVYVLVEQEIPAVIVYRRTEREFVLEAYHGLDAVLPLNEVGIKLPLVEIYRGVEFIPEESDDDGLTFHEDSN